MEKWKYHKIFLLESSRSIRDLLILLNSITQQDEKWRLDEVDICNHLHDVYENKTLSKLEIDSFIVQIDTIADLDISVIRSDNTVKLNLYCFDCNWVHIYTDVKDLMNMFTKHIYENTLGTLDYDESSE